MLAGALPGPERGRRRGTPDGAGRRGGGAMSGLRPTVDLAPEPGRRPDFAMATVNIVLLLVLFFLLFGTAASYRLGTIQPPESLALPEADLPPPPAPVPPPRPVETKDLSDPLRADLAGVGYPVTDAAPAGLTLAPAPEEPPSPSATVEALVAVVRAAAGTACLAARPENPAPGSLGLALFALPETDPAALVAEAQALVGDIALRRHDVAAKQCPALDFLRGAAAYPGNGLTLVLEGEALTGGDALAGVIAGAQPGAVVHLLLIDDAGLVQKLDAFLTALPEGRGRLPYPAQPAGQSGSRRAAFGRAERACATTDAARLCFWPGNAGLYQAQRRVRRSRRHSRSCSGRLHLALIGPLLGVEAEVDRRRRCRQRTRGQFALNDRKQAFGGGA